HVQLDPVGTGTDMGAGFLQLEQYRLENGRIGVLELDATLGGGGGHQIGAGLDAVGHDAVAATAQALHAVDADGVSAGALQLRADGDQEVGRVDLVRFSRGVFQHGAIVGQGGSQHDVLGAGDTDHV